MSVQAIAWVLDHSQSRGAARCVLISIANHVGPDGVGWVHVRRVCAEANCSHDTYSRSVREAEDRGELRRRPYEGGGARMHDRHRPNLFTFPALVDDTADPVVQVDRDPVQSGDGALVERLFDLWVEVCGKDATRTRLTSGRRAKIKARIKEGYSERDLSDAIRGVVQSPFHMGDNDRLTRYDDLTLIMRDGTQVERFGDIYRGYLTGSPQTGSQGLTGQSSGQSRHPAIKRPMGCDQCDGGFIWDDHGAVVVCVNCLHSPEVTGEVREVSGSTGAGQGRHDHAV